MNIYAPSIIQRTKKRSACMHTIQVLCEFVCECVNVCTIFYEMSVCNLIVSHIRRAGSLPNYSLQVSRDANRVYPYNISQQYISIEAYAPVITLIHDVHYVCIQLSLTMPIIIVSGLALHGSARLLLLNGIHLG